MSEHIAGAGIRVDQLDRAARHQRCLDADEPGVKQETTVAPLRRTRIGLPAELHGFLARNLDETTIAATGAAARLHAAGKPRVAVGPQHGLATISVDPRIGFETRLRAGADVVGVDHAGVQTGAAPTNQQHATTSVTVGAYLRRDKILLTAANTYRAANATDSAGVQRAGGVQMG